MKKLLVSVLAIAGLVACSQDTTLVQNSNSGTLMEFNVAALDNATRVDPSITSTTLDAFDIWAYVDSEAGTVLTKERVSRNGNMWSYVNKQYWTPEHTYYFNAIAPVDTNHWTYNLNDVNKGEDNTIAFTNVDGTEDLIYAHEEVTTPKELGQYMDAVGLQFNHLLSKVKFTFKNGFTTNNVYVAVENVEMDAPAAGTYTTTNGTWALENGTTTLVFGDVTDGETLDIDGTTVFAAQKSVRAADERFTIPAGAGQNYVVRFTVKHYNGNVCLSESNKIVNISGLNLENGKAYNFVTEINEQNAADAELLPIEFEVECVNEWVEVVKANDAADIQQIINEAETPVEVVLTGDISLDDLLAAGTLSTRAAGDAATITVPNGKVVTIDLNGYTLTATDTTAKNYSAIDNRGTLVVKNGTIEVVATVNSGWNRYSAVLANNPGGNLTVENVTLEHLGGTDMAYGIDNLTNGKGTSAVTTIKNSTVKSTYRAVRQFLNGEEATNEMYVEAGAVLEGANKSIFFHDPSKNANTGKLVVEAGAQLKGDVYLFVTAGSTEWPVEVSIASSALVNGSQVLSGNVPAGYDVVEKDGCYVVEYGVEVNGNEIAVSNAGGLKWVAQQVNSGADYFEGKTVVLTADVDLKGENWTPIGSATADHGFMGNFDGNGFAIKNLAIENIALGSDGYAYAGLFGVTEGVDKDNQNYIKNLVIENVNINTNGHIVAAAIAYPYYTVVENVTVKGNVSIKGGDYTAGVLAYTRRCVDAKNLAVIAGTIEGRYTVGGVISDIQTNGGLVANYSNFMASGVTVKGANCVGGISGIICLQTLDGATVENATIVCDDTRKGIVAGSLGGDSTINRVSVNNVSGADYLVGPLYGTEGRTVTIDGVVYEYNADGSLVIDGKSVVKVSTVEELNALKATNAYVMLCADLDFQGAAMAKPIEIWKDSTFDGMGHKISNVTTAVQGGYATSLFRGDANSGNKVVKNLVVENLTTPAGYSYAAAIWSDLQGANIEIDNVHVNNATIAAKGTIGGFVGFVSAGSTSVVVKNSTINNSNLNGGEADHKRGAVVGRAYGCVVNCENVVVENVKINDVAATETTLVGDKGYTGTVTVK